MTRTNSDPYLVLDVSPAATQAEITHAYRTRVRAHHPDTRTTLTPRAADEQLQKLLAAYALLRDPARRADYDRATTHADRSFHSYGSTPVERPTAERVQIPVSYRITTIDAPDVWSTPLRAGPVRRHQKRSGPACR